MKASTTRNRLVLGASVLALLAVWKLLSLIVGSSILLPSPEATIISAVSIFQQPHFWEAVGATVLRGLIGFAVSCLAGVIIGFIAGFNRIVSILFEPWIIVIRTTPVMSIIILAIIWFRADLVPVFATFLILFPIIYGNVAAGIANTDPQLLQMARVFKVKPWRIMTGVYFPSLLPYLASGASTAMGMAWKVIITSEILLQPARAIGSNMMLSKINLETGEVMAWTVVIIVISAFFEFALQLVEKKLQY